MAISPNPAAGPKKATLTPLWMALAVVLLMWLALPTVMVAGFGMVPTIVAYFIDRTPQKYAALCVGGMNFSGLFDVIYVLWTGANSPSDAMDLLTDPFNLLMVFGAAGFGWLLYMSLPPLVGAVLQVVAEQRMTKCREIQSDLIKEWGEDVSLSAQAIGMPPSEGEDGTSTGAEAAAPGAVPGAPVVAAPPQPPAA
jgi:hypothetical protein